MSACRNVKVTVQPKINYTEFPYAPDHHYSLEHKLRFFYILSIEKDHVANIFNNHQQCLKETEDTITSHAEEI